jgi:phosphohistidine phosphatase SixA
MIFINCLRVINTRTCLRLVFISVVVIAANATNFMAAAAYANTRDEVAPWAALRNGAIVLLRHANAPGVGDPAGFKLGDCGTQRNLDAQGREQARGIGARFRSLGITVGAVKTSQWCRTKETAELAFPGMPREEPAFNSFFDTPAQQAAQTVAARAQLLQWKGPGALVVVTHQVNITAITGVTPASGEGVVMQREGDALKVVGRLTP